jgi:CheY-like chemotaxis protein
MAAVSEETGKEQKKPTVLIVDDSKVVRVSMKKILGEIYNVIEAEDGEDGWMQVRKQEDIRCVFTDYSMPELDGFGLLSRIKGSSNPRVSELPVILVTGNEDDDSIRSKAKQSGFSEVVIKPFKPGEIRQCVGRYFPELQPAQPAPAPAPAEGVDFLRKEIERLKAQSAASLSRAEQSERTRLETDQELVRIKAELEVARLESAASGRDQQEMIKAKEEITRIQSQLLSVTNRAESAEAAHRKADQEIGELQGQLSRRQHEFAEQQLHREEQIKELQDNLGKSRSRVDESERARQKAEDEVKQLRTELMLRQQGAETETSQRVEKLREEISALHQDLEEARDEAQAARQIRKQVEQEMQRIQAENEAMNGRFKGVEEEFERSKRMAERLREDREAAVARAEASEESLAQAEQALEKLRFDMESMKEQEKEVRKVREEMASLRGEFDSLRIEKEAAEAGQSEMENELVELSTALEEMEQQKDAAEGRSIELQAALNDRREEEIKLRKRVAAMEATDNEIRKAPKQAKSNDPVEVEMDQAFASLDDFSSEEKNKKEVRDEGEVIELSGFWPDNHEKGAPQKEDMPIPPVGIRARPREPELLEKKSGMGLKIAVAMLLFAASVAGAAWFMGFMSPDAIPMAGEKPEAKAKAAPAVAESAPKPAVKAATKPAQVKKPEASSKEDLLAAKTGTVKRAPAAEPETKAESPEATALTEGKPGTTEVAGAALGKSESSTAEKQQGSVVPGQTGELAAEASPIVEEGVTAPVLPLESRFKEQEAQLRAEAETEFERLMKDQKGGVVPPAE